MAYESQLYLIVREVTVEIALTECLFFPVVWTIRDGVASFTANDIFGTNSIWSVVIWYHKSQARHAKQKDVANKSWYLQKKMF